MIAIKGMGTFETIPQIAADIIAGDTNALDSHLLKKWKIEKKIKLECSRGYVFECTPLDLALMTASFDSVKWLVEHGANLNAKYNHSFLIAARYCDEGILRFLVKNGAEVMPDQKYGADAFEQALYGNKLENLPIIHELGYTVGTYGSKGFFSAIMDNIVPAVMFFVESGIDVNADINFSDDQFRTTPLCAAARYADLELCKYLVAHGADVTVKEKSGMRPYNIALERGEFEMADFFKSLEPADFHNLQNKLAELKSYKLPDALLDFLQGDNLRFNFGKRTSDSGCEYIDFLPITDTLPMRAGRRKVLRISREIENYNSTHIVWNPKTQMIAFYDEEHSELGDIAPFEDFINNLAEYINKVISGT